MTRQEFDQRDLQAVIGHDHVWLPMVTQLATPITKSARLDVSDRGDTADLTTMTKTSLFGGNSHKIFQLG